VQALVQGYWCRGCKKIGRCGRGQDELGGSRAWIARAVLSRRYLGYTISCGIHCSWRVVDVDASISGGGLPTRKPQLARVPGLARRHDKELVKSANQNGEGEGFPYTRLVWIGGWIR
jgi:hypothetical protein